MEDARDGRFKGLLAPVCTKNKYTIEKKSLPVDGKFHCTELYTHIYYEHFYTSLLVCLTGASKICTKFKHK